MSARLAQALVAVIAEAPGKNSNHRAKLL
jgi:hypothetical protein